MDDRTIIISSRELVDHAVLSRKHKELSYKKEILLKNGAKEDDLHLSAINEEIASVQVKLAPIAEKLSAADMITMVPNRKEMDDLGTCTTQYAKGEIELAIKNKSGEVYEFMRKRAEFVKSNYERRDDIARLTILLNTLPRKEGETLRGLIEEGHGEDMDVSFLPKERQQELVNLTARLGRQCCVYAGSFSLDKKKADRAELKAEDEVFRTISGRKVWVPSDKSGEFDSNEKVLSSLLSKLQSKNAEKQTRSFSEEEMVSVEKVQSDYLAALQKRAEIAKGADLTETAKLYKKDSWKTSVEEY